MHQSSSSTWGMPERWYAKGNPGEINTNVAVHYVWLLLSDFNTSNTSVATSVPDPADDVPSHPDSKAACTHSGSKPSALTSRKRPLSPSPLQPKTSRARLHDPPVLHAQGDFSDQWGNDPQINEIVVANLSYAAREVGEQEHQVEGGYLPFTRGTRLLVRSAPRPGHAKNLYTTYVYAQAMASDGALRPDALGWVPRVLLHRLHSIPAYAMLLDAKHARVATCLHAVQFPAADGTCLLHLPTGPTRVRMADCALFDSVADVEMIRKLGAHHPALSDPAACIDGFACQIIHAMRA